LLPRKKQKEIIIYTSILLAVMAAQTAMRLGKLMPSTSAVFVCDLQDKVSTYSSLSLPSMQ